MEHFIDEILELEEVRIVNGIRRQYTIRERPNYLEILDDFDFFRRFRLKKHTVLLLLGKINDQLLSKITRNSNITPITQLLVTLRYYASGSMYVTVADFAGISKAAACRIIEKVTNAICALRPEYIKLPSTVAERSSLMDEFFKIAQFPKVIGAIDCTHVQIQSPGGTQAEHFKNQKGSFSMNVQCVCDAALKFADVEPHWPGATHDDNIFDSSRIRARFENKEMADALLLGDSGYACRDYLITPLHEPQNRAEDRFNESQMRTRNVIERTLELWTGRFPILSIGMRCKIPLVQSVIMATAILHNLSRDAGEDMPPDVDVHREEIENDVILLGNSTQVQRQLIEYFST
uniref:DDE Tnp4 domain-containing protein n=1 Tax=Photinus pyralis TaxID=7054 RepID=A0A1Y1M620_PHOPY